MKRKFLTVLLAFVLVLSLGLAGCGETHGSPANNSQVGQGGTENDQGGGSENGTPAPEPEPMTFAEFLEAHRAAGKAFFTEHVRSAVTQAVVLAETVNFVAEEDDTELEQISYAYIYKTEGTARKYDVATLTLPTPVSFDDIASGEAGDVTPAVNTELSFGFDAKENVEKSDLIDALSSRIGKFTNINSSAHKYLTTVEHGANSLGSPTLTYKVLFEDNNKFFVDSIKVYDEGYDDATLIENLLDDAKFNNMRWGEGFGEEVKLGKLQGETIYKSEYKPEYQKEEPGPEIPGAEIEDVEDLVTNYSTELNQGLQGAYDHIVEKVLPSHFAGFNENKIVEGKWNLQTNTSGAIEKINYIGKYELSTGNYTLFIASADFSIDPIVLNDLTDKNITQTLQTMINSKNATYNYELNFGYNAASQSQYQELAETIFEKEGLKEIGATYYISSWAGAQDGTLGRYQTAEMLQVSPSGTKRLVVRIKEDGGLADNVEAGLYRTSNKTSYDFGQYTIDAETNKVATTSFSLYNEDMA